MQLSKVLICVLYNEKQKNTQPSYIIQCLNFCERKSKPQYKYITFMIKSVKCKNLNIFHSY